MAAAAAYPLPFGTGSEARAFQISGRPVHPNEPAMFAQVRLVTPEFFSVLRIPLKRGRVFGEQDSTGTERLILVDETLAHRYWPDQDPVGQQVVLQGGIQGRIVGIVGHTRQSDLASNSESGVFYYSLYQQPIPLATLLVRTAGRPASAAALREAVSAADRHRLSSMLNRWRSAFPRRSRGASLPWRCSPCLPQPHSS